MTMTALRVVWLALLLGIGTTAFCPIPTSRRQLTHLGSSNEQEETPTTQNDDVPSSRRHVLQQAAGLSLASLLLGTNPALASVSPKTIVMTGANSGVGFEATQQLAARGHTIVLACRTLAKAQAAVAKMGGDDTLIPAECDLASLVSIQQFAKELPQLLPDTKLDALCLNAGIARSISATDCARSADGFELTVGINHFGHFYLNHLLLPLVNADTGKIIVTASSVHDPESGGGKQGVPATLGTLQGLEQQGKRCEMLDGGPFNADKAYKDSKLCNVLFTRELQRRLQAKDSTRGIVANCFSPGLIVGTGLFRDQNPVFTKVFDVAATNVLKVGETPAWGGGCLTYMVDSVDQDRGQYYFAEPGSSKYGDKAYGVQFAPFPVSVEAQDDSKAKRLWELTERELGLV